MIRISAEILASVDSCIDVESTHLELNVQPVSLIFFYGTMLISHKPLWFH